MIHRQKNGNLHGQEHVLKISQFIWTGRSGLAGRRPVLGRPNFQIPVVNVKKTEFYFSTEKLII